MELLRTFEYKELKVETYFNGTDKVPNKTYLNNILVYEDETFRPSPLYDINSKAVMVALLWFLVLTDDDIEDEFFEDRNAIELTNWAKTSTDAEDIKCMINDYDLKDDDTWRVQAELTKAEVIRIEDYIQ